MKVKFEFIKEGNVWTASCPFCNISIDRDDPDPTLCGTGCDHYVLTTENKSEAIFTIDGQCPTSELDSIPLTFGPKQYMIRDKKNALYLMEFGKTATFESYTKAMDAIINDASLCKLFTNKEIEITLE